MRLREAVLGRDVPRPGLDGIRGDLDGGAAAPADQVVMMTAGGACPEQALALLLQGVRGPL
jgi:hypothetical protein